MLKKLRRKFVCITMTIVSVVLVVMLGLILLVTAQNTEAQSLRSLSQLAQEPLQPFRPGPPDKDRNILWFSVHAHSDGTVMVHGSEPLYISEDPTLAGKLLALAWEGEQTGEISDYSLRYYRGATPAGRYAFFADISAERDMLASLALNCVVIGLFSFAALLGISILLARWAVKPVEQAWQEQRQFVADASHELKTPLTVITTNAQLLADSRPDDPGQTQIVESIRQMSAQMRNLVERLLDLARVDNGKVAMETVDLTQAVTETALPFEAVFFEAGLTLESDLTPNILVKGDRAYLQQLTDILLDNACKYAAANTTVTLRLKSWGSRECRLSVASCGDALSREELDNIFKRFYRVDRVRTLSKSYGLGLPIARNIAQAHGGSIWAQSQGGVNTFTVQLPILRSHTESTGADI